MFFVCIFVLFRFLHSYSILLLFEVEYLQTGVEWSSKVEYGILQNIMGVSHRYSIAGVRLPIPILLTSDFYNSFFDILY